MISRGNHKMQTCWIYKIFHLRIKDGISYSLMQILKLRYWIFLAPWGQHIKLETQYWHIINLSWQTVVHIQQIWSDISINSELCFCPPEEFMSSIHAPFWSPPTIWLFSCQKALLCSPASRQLWCWAGGKQWGLYRAFSLRNLLYHVTHQYRKNICY